MHVSLLVNIRLAWKSLPGTNAVTYFASASVTKKKKFYNNEFRQVRTHSHKIKALRIVFTKCIKKSFRQHYAGGALV